MHQPELSDRHLATQLDRAPNAFVTLSGAGSIFAWNDAASHLFGVTAEAAVGADATSILPPEVAGELRDLMALALSGEAFTGQPVPLPSAGRPKWVELSIAPVRDNQQNLLHLSVTIRDVTERRHAAERREALSRLTDIFRSSDDADEVEFTATRILGEALGVHRIAYATINPDTETLRIDRDWNAPGIVALPGSLRLRDYGSFVDSLKRGEVVKIADVRNDPRTAEAADSLQTRGARALLAVPIIEHGRLVALLYAKHETVREWLPDEIALIGEVAERARIAAERIRGVAALRENESRLRFLDALGKEAAKSTNADAILATTTRMLGQHLDVAICAYADMDADQDGFTIRGGWSAPGSPSIVGHYSLADFGKLAVKNLGAGLPLIVNDNLAELAPEEAATFQNIGIAATICMPLVKEGRLIALMAIHGKVPRRWRANELALLTEVTERSWAHIERVSAEAELKASEKQFRTFAQAMPNHVWTAPSNGKLDWFNAQVYEYSGMKPGELDGDGWGAMIHPEDRAESFRRWHQAAATGRDYENEFRLRRHDGAWRWHLSRAVTLRDDDGTIVRWIGTNTDVDDQKNAETLLEQRLEQRTAALAQTEAQLRQAVKMEAVGQLTGGIAHDFNNLLGAISGSLELLERRLSEGRTLNLNRYISAAQEGARRAATLTQRLLAFSRRQTLDPRPTDANRLIDGMAELIQRSVGPTVEVEVIGGAGLWITKVDPSQLESSLLNLCINARDAMAPNGGRLTVETANRWLDETAAKERELPPGQYISLCVSDTGTGMGPDVIARAFDPFYTTKPLGEGTGLGLSMVYGFVRQSGGQVRIYSELGNGTTMCLYLPRYIGSADAADQCLVEQIDPGHGETVLVIEDEASIRMLIVEVLQESGYRVIEAADGQAGLQVLQTDARIDLLVTDVGLPGGINGRQVADAARVHRPDLKVLFITGFAENAAIGNGLLGPGMEVITKPFVMTTFANKARDLIDR
ncbi:MAG: hypothetical protein JWN71_1576 [Xanthobacteraceae bacterium]|nr:hypothetical protein [Xanthobacteraceae bacterium]